MQFTIVDTREAYERLLAEDDATSREAIFRESLVAPFSGLFEVFGGGDGLAMFAQWGLSPDQFAEPQREATRAVIDGLAATNGWQRAAESLKRGRDAFRDYHDRIPLERSVFGLFVGEMRGSPVDDYGYTGFGGIPGWIMTVYGKATPFNLERIEACTVHELHHNLWGTVFPKNFMTETTVGDYMVMEGLAESFAGELYGQDKVGPWTSRFDEAQLEPAKRVIAEHLDDTGFNTIRSYIFGDQSAEDYMNTPKVGVPPYAGYALGYRIVQAFLERTGQSVADATFVPPSQIIAESGFFD